MNNAINKKFDTVTEVEFAAILTDALDDHLEWVGAENPLVTHTEYNGIITDKPALAIEVDGAEFLIVIVRTR